MRSWIGLVALLVAFCGCDKSTSSSTKEDPPAEDEGVPVAKYCKKLVSLSNKTAPAAGEPTKDEQLTFCTMMFTNAKNKEPKAFACMADCMMSAETHEDEQTCVADKKCLAKAKNKKLFSNRVD